jgi:glycosyltransferase involved in cell wall biosynthesis
VPKVSIIVPNYNHDKFLPKRLDSIFSQSFDDFEVILLDDASTDESVKILTRYSDHPKVTHMIINKHNSGSPFIQWAKGIELAKGELIWIAESDDWADNNFLDRLVPYFDDTKIGLAYCGLNWIDYHGERLTDQTYHKKSFVRSGYEEITKHLLIHNSIQNVSSVVFLSKALISINLDSLVNYKSCGDWILYIQILKNWDLAFDKEPLCHFRRHPTSISLGGEESGQWLEEGCEVFNFFQVTKYLRFREYKKIVQSWLMRSRKLPKKVKRNVANKIISNFSYLLRFYFWSFYFRINYFLD